MVDGGANDVADIRRESNINIVRIVASTQHRRAIKKKCQTEIELSAASPQIVKMMVYDIGDIRHQTPPPPPSPPRILHRSITICVCI